MIDLWNGAMHHAKGTDVISLGGYGSTLLSYQ